jgi:hypothetical protein
VESSDRGALFFPDTFASIGSSDAVRSALEHREKDYRGATIMKSFQLIHYYAFDIDTVYIDAIWDMRMNPVKLEQMIK